MANEPERPIEKLLRAAARKRRDEAGAPLALHPADRRLLQGEVARKYAQPLRTRRSFAQALAQLRPRFVWAVGMLAVLCVTVWLLLPVPGSHKPEAALAQRMAVSKDLPANELSAPAASAPATPAPPPASVVKTESPMLAYGQTAQPAPGKAPAEVGLTTARVAETSAAALSQKQEAATLGLAGTETLADRQEPATARPARPAGMPAQTAAAGAGGAAQNSYRSLSGAIPPPAQSVAPAAPATVAMTPATVSAQSAGERAKVLGAVSPPPAAAPAVALNEPAQSADDKSGQPNTFYRSLAAVDSVNRRSPSSVATDSLLKSVPGTLQESKAVSVAQRYVQVPPAAKVKDALTLSDAVAHPVLASFQVEQSGPTLRIVDGDGSVYTGSLQLVTATRRARAARSGPAVTPPPAEAPAKTLDLEALPRLEAQQTYAFRVAGTNRSLRQKVVFAGNLLTATNLTVSLQLATNQAIGGGLGRLQGAPTQQNLVPLVNSRITGKLVIGNGKAVEINALPANP